MADYGPPDGRPGDPWRSRRHEDAYGPPEHGWRDQDAYPPGPNRETYPPAYDNPPRYDSPPYHDNPPRYDSPPYHDSPPHHDNPYAGRPAYRPQQEYGAGYGAEPRRPGYAPGNAGPIEAPSGYPAGLAGYQDAPIPPPRRSRGRGPLIAVLATVLLLVLGGGAGVLFLLGRNGNPPPTPSPTAPADAGSSAPAADVGPAPTVAAPDSSADPRFVKIGQCVRNDGPAGGKPKLLISRCAARTYEVLHRVDGPTTGEKDAAAKCATVDGYTNWYFFDSELDTLDFVLCLKQR